MKAIYTKEVLRLLELSNKPYEHIIVDNKDYEEHVIGMMKIYHNEVGGGLGEFLSENTSTYYVKVFKFVPCVPSVEKYKSKELAYIVVRLLSESQVMDPNSSIL